jgi:hypothetical protein
MARKSVYELNYSFEAPDIKKSELLGKQLLNTLKKVIF